MCLSYVTNNKHYPEKTGIGYKIVEDQGDGFINLVFSFYKGTKLLNPYHKWLKADEQEVKSNIPLPFQPKMRYEPGFHIFETEKDAKIYLSYISTIRNLKIVRVHYKNVVAQGVETFDSGDAQVMNPSLRVIVAKEMMIEKTE